MNSIFDKNSETARQKENRNFLIFDLPEILEEPSNEEV